MRRSKALVTALVLTILPIPITSLADADSHNVPLHFSHPLFAESPFPDTKIRTDYIFRNEAGEEKAETHTARFNA